MDPVSAGTLHGDGCELSCAYEGMGPPNEIEQALSQLGIGRAILVGHSQQGATAVERTLHGGT